eukprot:GHRR01023497.1.p3 GENE.GHRR01023497.1~~GHRR01023497.1.p3  ORF type:complete len:216 (-),score=85.94 GHRR01023497.1:1406-2053(-)
MPFKCASSRATAAMTTTASAAATGVHSATGVALTTSPQRATACSRWPATAGGSTTWASNAVLGRFAAANQHAAAARALCMFVNLSTLLAASAAAAAASAAAAAPLLLPLLPSLLLPHGEGATASSSWAAAAAMRQQQAATRRLLGVTECGCCNILVATANTWSCKAPKACGEGQVGPRPLLLPPLLPSLAAVAPSPGSTAGAVANKNSKLCSHAV